jgi:hypothetical protein
VDDEVKARYVGFTRKNNEDHVYVQRPCSECGVQVWVNSERLAVIEQMVLICEGCARALAESVGIAGVYPAEVLDVTTAYDA